MTKWERRRIGKTGLEATVLGFGTATMGGSRIPVTREESEAMVVAAWDAGLRYVDTAPFYGVGSSERRVGDALRDKPRDEWVLSTKVGRLLKPRRQHPASTDGRLAPLPFTVVYDYSHDGIMRSVEDSYQRLGLDRIDILYVHDIGTYQHGEAAAGHMKVLRDSGYKALTGLKAAGVVQAIGIGVNEKAVLLEAMGWGEWDVFLLAGRYTLLEQAPLEDLLPLCAERGTSIVIGGPLNSGILAGRDTWNYAPAPANVVERVKRIQAVCDRHNVPLPAAALQFPLAHPVVAATIPGPRTVAEFRTNVELIGMKIPAALWAELKHEKLLHAEAPVPG
ncbi:MAG TPA: aldo/keto reductase [Acetobacteraceae bacterium]|nr:aldo/keto reductase [Acetobacteraceae bacterium]